MPEGDSTRGTGPGDAPSHPGPVPLSLPGPAASPTGRPDPPLCTPSRVASEKGLPGDSTGSSTLNLGVPTPHAYGCLDQRERPSLRTRDELVHPGSGVSGWARSV